ncbi:MAG: hypothetical protein ACRC0L_04275, partial [Angustibacter sp.]
MAGLGEVLGRGERLIDKAATVVGIFRGAIADVVEDVATLERQWQDSHRDYQAQMTADVVGPFASEDERAAAKEWKVSNAESWWARDEANFDRRFAEHKETLLTAARAFVRDLAECQLVTLPGPLADTARGSADGVTAVGFGFVSQELSPELQLMRRYHEEGFGLFTSPEDAQAEARRIAALRNADVELSPADRELLARAAKNRWFSHTYAVERGARNMAGAASSAAADVCGLKDRIPPVSKEELAAFQAEQEQIIDAEAMALSTASGTLGPEFAQKLVDLALVDKGAAYGVSVIMHRGGDFAPVFEDVLTEGIYQADRHGGKAGKWGYSDPGNLLFPSAWVPLYGQVGWADPMTGVLAMKSRDPAEAQRF